MFRTTSSARHGIFHGHAASCKPKRPSTRPISEDLKKAIVERLLGETRLDFSDVEKWREESLRETLQPFFPEHLELHRSLGVPPGHHLLHFPKHVSTNNLLPDGTDKHFWPGIPWFNRLWAGGRMLFLSPGLKYTDKKVLVEYVRDVRFQGEDKIFVKIERRIKQVDSREMNSESSTTYLKDLSKRVDEDDLSNTLLLETRDLCFLPPPKIGTSVIREKRIITPPADPEYTRSLTPTPAHLFRFSALTWNAHAIHIDPDYTRKFYGLPNLLVHGPLMLILMLSYVGIILKDLEIKQGEPNMVITEINYRNLAPLFVNEEMTICCKRRRTRLQAHSTWSSIMAYDDARAQSRPSPIEWDVWIQTGQGDQASLAVRGTVKVEEAENALSSLKRGMR